MAKLTQERLIEVLHYNPITGLFTNKITRGKLAAGKLAGHVERNGYVNIMIDGHSYGAHRLAWLYTTGEMPSAEIDHKDMDPSNNKLENLRLATRGQNNANRRVYSNNKLGVKGLKKTKSGKYQVRVNGTYYGVYDNLELAEFIAQVVRESMHKEFARHG